MTRVTADTTESRHPVDQVLPFAQMFVYGLQHVLQVAVPGHASGQPPRGRTAEGDQ